MTQRTFAMIKPDAVKSGHIGEIIGEIEPADFKIVGMKKMCISPELAKAFYAVHASKPFFTELVQNISAGAVVALVLEKSSAIQAWRDLMGATNPAQAASGTLRKKFGTSISYNAVHGSDAPETAKMEIKLVFPELAG